MNKFKFLQIFLGILFILSLGYNMLIALNLKYEADGDAWDYIHLALSVAKTGEYGHSNSSRNQLLEDFKNNKINQKDYKLVGKTAFRPPIWPFLIAGIFLVFGYNLTYVLIFKFLLHLLGVFIFYKTLKLLSIKQMFIIIGTFLYAVSPAWQLYSRVFLSEPITLFFITLWLFLIIKLVLHKTSWWPQAVISGIFVLCHPYYIFLPFTVWLLLSLNKQLSSRIMIYSSLLCMSIISFWIIRNFIVFNTNEIVLTTSSGAVMAKGWNKDLSENHTNTKGDLADEGLVLLDYQYKENAIYSEVKKMQLYKDATIHFIRSNPELILPIITKKLLSAFNPFPETPRPGFLEIGRWIYHLIALISIIYILLFSRNKLLKTFALSLILCTVAITTLTYSGFRFRMPQTGLEMLFIIFAIEDVLKKIKRVA